MDHAFRKGEPIQVRLPETFSGTFEGIDTSGHLLLKPQNGKRMAISAGDVVW